ncbi:uncharacterized protein [Antedon mediterranea]|uniref:uncharacterized protein n=1 Tax=Antedon mediterranea TaxID=105859 RepID=UPI003AF56116
MLYNENVGCHTLGTKISCLFWADDVVLIAKDENDLEKMLSIAGIFSKKWKLNFNYDKSNVVVVGKRTNKTKQWPLVNHFIKEVDCYKYLGVNISRNFSESIHVNDVVRKGNRLIGYYIKSIINEQEDFNRIYFGNILWKTIALPSINYACAISAYSASDYKKIENIQLQMAKTLLKAPRNTPSLVLLGDLGWDSIENTHNEIKIKYFDRLINLEAHRWPKLLLHALFTLHDNNVNIKWRWLNSIKSILNNTGFNHVFSNNIPIDSAWFKSFKCVNRQMYELDWFNKSCTKPSLSLYVKLKKMPELENYLTVKTDFHGAQLKFKARSNTLQLESRLSKWDMNNTGNCMLCKDEPEDLYHFMLNCIVLQEVRISEFECLEQNLNDSGLSDLWNSLQLNNSEVILMIILGGDCSVLIPTMSINMVNKAHDILDKFCKSYLKKAWAFKQRLTLSNDFFKFFIVCKLV